MTDHQMAKIERGGTDVPVGTGHAPTGGAGPVERSFLIRPTLPCVTCDHAPVCSIKPKLEAAAIEYRTPASPDPAVKVRVEMVIICEYYRGVVDESGSDHRDPIAAPMPIKPTVFGAAHTLASSQRGAAASKAQRAAGTAGSSVGTLSTLRGATSQRAPAKHPTEPILAAIRADLTISYTKLAIVVGWEATAITYRLKAMRSRGELPEDIGAWVDTRRAMAGAGIRG